MLDCVIASWNINLKEDILQQNLGRFICVKDNFMNLYMKSAHV